MKKCELSKLFEMKNISENAYSLDGGICDDKYVLSQETGGRWTVYYCERGNKIGITEFFSEDEACDFFYKKVTGDTSTKKL